MQLRIHNLKIKILLGFLLSFFALQAQVPVPFTVRYQNTIKGDMTMIANGIVNRDGGHNYDEPRDAYNDNVNNDNFDMKYIDVDGDNSTFSSSKATLTVPNISCSRVVYAGLYWSGIYTSNAAGRNAIKTVKLKRPGIAGYTSVTGNFIFDGHTLPAFSGNSPYACYADITNLITADRKSVV